MMITAAKAECMSRWLYIYQALECMRPSQANPYHMHNSAVIFLSANFNNLGESGSAPFNMHDVDWNSVLVQMNQSSD